MSATTLDRTGTRDGLLRLAMRADAAISALAGVTGVPLAGWLSEASGTTKAFEYGMAAFLISYGVVVFTLAAVFRATIGEHAQQRNLVLFEERQHAVVEKLGRGNRRLGRIQLSGSPLRVVSTKVCW